MMRLGLISSLFFSFGLAACAGPKIHQSPGSSVLDPASRDVLTGQIPVTDTSMDQIGPAKTGNMQDQISALTADEAITAEQLRTYIDRCAPGAGAPPLAGINCDELRLMIERRYKSDDDLNRALNVLENLGRGGEADVLLDPTRPDGQLPPDVLQTPPPQPAVQETPGDPAANGVPDSVLFEQSGG